MNVIRIKNITPEIVAAFESLMPQLSPNGQLPSQERLQEIVGEDNVAIFAVEADGCIVGILTLAWYMVPSGCCAWIEDVVVETSHRGCGIGEMLVGTAIEHAQSIGADKISLTSNVARQAAHRLYKRMGFEEHDTTVFRYKNLSKIY